MTRSEAATNVVYVMLLTNAMELGENNRFRFTIEPLVAVLLAPFVHRTARGLRGLRADRRPGPPPGTDSGPRVISFEVL